MNQQTNSPSIVKDENTVAIYTTPAIIYEGILSTRAGSPIETDNPLSNPTSNDLFGD